MTRGQDKDRLTRLEERVANLTWWYRLIAGALATGLVARWLMMSGGNG